MNRGVRIIAALVLLAAVTCQAQTIAPRVPFVLNIDYAQFRNDDSSNYVEIYYGFYAALVTYQLKDTLYQGYVKIRTKIRNKATDELVVHDVSPLPVRVRDTSDASYRSARIAQVGYAIPHGDYVLEVLAVDSLMPSRRDSIVAPFSLKAYGTSVIVSDLELCSRIISSDQKSVPFYKNALEVMPNPSLVFGATFHPMLFYYAELYNLNPEQTYKVSAQILSPDGKVAKESSKSRKFGLVNAVEAGMVNVGVLQSAKYHLRLLIEDDAGSKLTQVEKLFFVYNPHIPSAQPAQAMITGHQFAGFTAEELADEFRKAQYIATDQEIKSFGEVPSAEGRREFLEKFWTAVEAGRSGRPGIQRFTYLQRVGVANQRYRAFTKEGWRSDRGRVLILYGEPDEVERYPSSEEHKPHETWHFYAIENGVQFVFVDRTGFGEYILVHSTKRGELRDEQWQRFLK